MKTHAVVVVWMQFTIIFNFVICFWWYRWYIQVLRLSNGIKYDNCILTSIFFVAGGRKIEARVNCVSVCWGGAKIKKSLIRVMLMILQKSRGTPPRSIPTRFAGPIFRCRISEIIMMMHVHNVAKFQEEPGSEMTDAQKDCVLFLCYINIVVFFARKFWTLVFMFQRPQI